MLLSLLVCLATITVIPITHGHTLRKREAGGACGTEQCNRFAQRILDSVDKSVDPCTDFYQYACGSWSKHNPIPANEIAWSVFAKTKEMTDRRVRDSMIGPEDPDSPKSVKQAQRFYQSCLNTDKLEEKGIEPLENIVNNLGGWPIAMPVDAWDPAKNPWTDIQLSYYEMIGDMALYTIAFMPNDEDAKKFTISFGHTHGYPFNMRHKNLARLSSRSNYLDTIVEVVNIFAQGNGEVSADQILQDASDMILLETILQNMTSANMQEYINGVHHNTVTISEMQTFYDSVGELKPHAQVNWLEQIKHVFRVVEDQHITSDSVIYTFCNNCTHTLAKTLSQFSERTLVNYIHWMFISTHMAYSNRQMRRIAFNYTHTGFDVASLEEKPRWKECMDEVPLRDGMGYLFVETYFTDKIINNAIEMTGVIRDELKKKVKLIEWASPTLKEHMIDKLDHINMEIGYPAWYKNKTVMDHLYGNVEIGSDYLQNIINFNTDDLIRQRKMLSTGFPEQEWLDYPITVNAFYYAPGNTMLLPAAQIQEPYFVRDMPNAINYGFIGVIVGHELGHGLDTYGINYDKDGNRLAHMLEGMLSEYKPQAQCFIDQFSNYTLKEVDENGEPIKLDGVQTLAENIADTLGVQVAYAGYKKTLETDENTPKTLENAPDVDDTKLFFLSFATGWCYDVRKSNEPQPHLDEHSPPEIRVNGALSNVKAFSDAFNCPVGSPLNREHKCTL